MKLVVFEDYTLMDAKYQRDIAKLAGKEDAFKDIDEKLDNGDIEYKDAIKQKAGLLKDLDAEKVHDAVRKISLVSGAVETISKLKSRGIKTGVISDYNIFADKIKDDLDMDYSYSNELATENGKITGKIKGQQLKDKGEPLEDIARDAGVPLKETAIVCSSGNKHLFKNTGLSIIDPSKDLKDLILHVFGEFNMDDMIKEIDEQEITIRQLKKDIFEKKSAIVTVNARRRELINRIKLKNNDANRSRELRDELNEKIKTLKNERNEINEVVKGLLEEFNKLKETTPRGDFRWMGKELKKMEWHLQTTVMEIKKEDELVKKIEKLKKELGEYKDLIEISKKIDDKKKISRGIHKQILSLSNESQQHHEKFLDAIKDIREIEIGIDEQNKQKNEIITVLENSRAEFKDARERLKSLERNIKNIETENVIKSSKETEKELKKKANGIYKRFKKGEKLDLEDIYLLRRFDLV